MEDGWASSNGVPCKKGRQPQKWLLKEAPLGGQGWLHWVDIDAKSTRYGLRNWRLMAVMSPLGGCPRGNTVSPIGDGEAQRERSPTSYKLLWTDLDNQMQRYKVCRRGTLKKIFIGEFIEIVSPGLHHFAAFFQVFCVVICCTHSVFFGMSQLALDCIRMPT